MLDGWNLAKRLQLLTITCGFRLVALTVFTCEGLPLMEPEVPGRLHQVGLARGLQNLLLLVQQERVVLVGCKLA